MLRNIADQILLLAGLLGQDALPEVTRLRKVVLGHFALELDHTAAPALPWRRGILRGRVDGLEAGRVVSWGRGRVGGGARLTLVRSILEAGGAVTTHGVEVVAGTVDGQLGKVCAEAVALGVLVGEGADLEDCDICC